MPVYSLPFYAEKSYISKCNYLFILDFVPIFVSVVVHYTALVFVIIIAIDSFQLAYFLRSSLIQFGSLTILLNRVVLRYLILRATYTIQ